jgi:signal transduction histidine kinase
MSFATKKVSITGDPDGWATLLAGLVEKNARLAKVASRESENSSGRIFAALERERSRIAADLHSGAGQPLAGIGLNLEIIERSAEDLPSDAREAVDRLRRLAATALSEVRAVSHRLHPPDWQVLTTAAAICRLLDELGAAELYHPLQTSLQDLPIEPDYSTRVVLYRCAQECVSNVMRHSGATEMSVSLQQVGDEIVLRVMDNGRGIPDTALHGSGLGLRSIRERAESAGGVVQVVSGPDGTNITVRVPLKSDSEFGDDERD